MTMHISLIYITSIDDKWLSPTFHLLSIDQLSNQMELNPLQRRGERTVCVCERPTWLGEGGGEELVTEDCDTYRSAVVLTRTTEVCTSGLQGVDSRTYRRLAFKHAPVSGKWRLNMHQCAENGV